MADTVTMPKLGFDMAEGTLVRWVKNVGETVNKEDILAEIETDKATVEVESTFSGVVYRQLVEAGTVVPINKPIAIIIAPGEVVPEEYINAAMGNKMEPSPQPAVEQKTEPPAAPANVPLPDSEKRMIKASPLAKRIASEFGISLAGISGSGPGGRIVKKDIEQAEAAVESNRTKVSATTTEPKFDLPSIPSVDVWNNANAEHKDKQVPVTKLKAAIARRMVQSKLAPHFYVTHEYDMASLMKLRKELNEFMPEAERFSVNDFIVKAAALTLRQFPNINASFNDTEIVQHGSINIGVAVAMENGLLTVVCQDADIKPLRVISVEIKNMAARARLGKVKPEEIEGSTFSISNLGMFDVENFAAILNSPEAAILAVSSVKQVPVVTDGALTVGTRMKATLSADHRVTDGAEAAQFMQKMGIYLEKPMSLLI